MFDSSKTGYIQNASGFASKVSSTFGLTPVQNTTNFTANNGIKYSFTKKNNVIYYIEMQVPQAKNRINPNGNLTARVAYNTDSKILMPIAGGNVNLQERTVNPGVRTCG